MTNIAAPDRMPGNTNREGKVQCSIPTVKKRSGALQNSCSWGS